MIQRFGGAEQGRCSLFPFFFDPIDGQEGFGKLFPRLTLEPFLGFLKLRHIPDGFIVFCRIGAGSGGGGGYERETQRQQNAP